MIYVKVAIAAFLMLIAGIFSPQQLASAAAPTTRVIPEAAARPAVVKTVKVTPKPVIYFKKYDKPVLPRKLVRELVKVTSPKGTKAWELRSAECIVMRESNGHLRERNWATASGLFQFLDSTWKHWKGYRSADRAPAVRQAQRFWMIWHHGTGKKNWYWAGHKQCW